MGERQKQQMQEREGCPKGMTEQTAQIKERASYLPAAEVLKEKVQGCSPHHRSGHDAEEWQQEDLLGAAEL